MAADRDPLPPPSDAPGPPVDHAGEIPTLREDRTFVDAAVARYASAEPVNSLPVKHWDRYQFAGYLGDGGMGRVFKAFDPVLKRHVALKFLRGEDADQELRFKQEAQAQAQVDHERVCKVYEVGEVEGKPYIAMQFVDGLPLDKAAPQMSLEEKLWVMKEVAHGLHAAHRSGLLHRDVKPGNVMVARAESGRWTPFVMDFGIARDLTATSTTRQGALVGTPYYMSPEQVRATGALDRRSDVYGLGATLYEVLTGRVPFAAASLRELLTHIVEDVPESPRRIDPTIPVDVEAITMKCLRKDPGERYASARALAEDLERYLDGEPVQARPTTLMYRLKMKAAKNKLAVGVGSVAFALISAALVWGGYTQLTAVRRAALAQTFGQQVERIEALARYAYTAPLHDVRPERVALRERLTGIERRMRELGSIATGPGEYALGRGALALEDRSGARTHLEAAWAAGYREPPVAYALGVVLGDQYREALSEAESITDKSLRELRVKQMHATLRDPALEFLKLGEGADLDSHEYARALMALYEERYDAALEQAAAASRRLPWLYEAHALAGEVHVRRANEKGNHGDYAGADAEYALADAAYTAATRGGESDPAVHAGVCEIARSRMRSALNGRGEDVTGYFEQGVTACDAALTADADDFAAASLKAELYRRLGQYQRAKGRDDEPALREAVAAAQRAVTAHPDRARAWSALGGASAQLAESRTARGLDPREISDTAIAAYRTALERDPGEFNAANDLGIAHKERALYEQNHGGDPAASFAAAIAAYRRSLQIQPQQFAANTNLGVVYFYLAKYSRNRGVDPGDALSQAEECFRRALEINPDAIAVHYQRGRVYESIADQQRDRAVDPRATLQMAVDSYRRAIDVNPHSVYVANLQDGSGNALLAMARYEASVQLDPRANFARALVAFAEASRANPTYVYAYNNRGNALWTQAEYLLDQGGVADLQRMVDDAIASCRKALSIKPDFAEAWSNLGDAYRVGVRDQIRRGANPGASLRSGAEAFRQALDLNPGATYALAGLGRLQGIEARFRAARGAGAGPLFERAERTLLQAIAAGEGTTAVFGAVAELWRDRNGARVHDRSLAAVPDKDRRWAQKYLSLRRGDPEALALESELTYRVAQSLPAGDARRSLSEDSRQLLRRAIAARPELEREYGARLAELARE